MKNTSIIFLLPIIFLTASLAYVIDNQFQAVELGLSELSPRDEVSGYTMQAAVGGTAPIASITQDPAVTEKGGLFRLTYGRSGGGPATSCSLEYKAPGDTNYTQYETDSSGGLIVKRMDQTIVGLWEWRARCIGPGGTSAWVSLNHTVTAARQTHFQLTGKVEQEVVDCSDSLFSSTKAYTDTDLYVSITPKYPDSVIKVSFMVPRIDVGLITGAHSERTATVRVVDQNDKPVGSHSGGFIIGRVLPGGGRHSAGTYIGHVSGLRYYAINNIQTKTFNLQFGPGITNLTEAKIRGDISPYCITLQEMRTKDSDEQEVSFLQGINLMAQAILAPWFR